MFHMRDWDQRLNPRLYDGHRDEKNLILDIPSCITYNKDQNPKNQYFVKFHRKLNFVQTLIKWNNVHENKYSKEFTIEKINLWI